MEVQREQEPRRTVTSTSGALYPHQDISQDDCLCLLRHATVLREGIFAENSYRLISESLERDFHGFIPGSRRCSRVQSTGDLSISYTDLDKQFPLACHKIPNIRQLVGPNSTTHPRKQVHLSMGSSNRWSGCSSSSRDGKNKTAAECREAADWAINHT